MTFASEAVKGAASQSLRPPRLCLCDRFQDPNDLTRIVRSSGIHGLPKHSWRSPQMHMGNDAPSSRSK